MFSCSAVYALLAHHFFLRPSNTMITNATFKSDNLAARDPICVYNQKNPPPPQKNRVAREICSSAGQKQSY